MQVITEAYLRKTFRARLPERLEVMVGQIVTPAAHDLLREKKVAIIRVKERSLPSSKGMYMSVTGKPDHLTQLCGPELVSKGSPQIALRGRLDSLQAEILLLHFSACKDGYRMVADAMTELLSRSRQILKAEVTGAALTDADLLGLSEADLREYSHRPEKYFGMAHLLPDSAMGEWLLRLNRLRTYVREVELAAVTAFCGDSADEPKRPDILKALNRMSSAVYILMLKDQTQGRSVGADQELVGQILRLVGERKCVAAAAIPVEVSARHVHLSQEDVMTLFGAPLTKKRELSQPGEYLCHERLRLIGPNGVIENVAVLGPARSRTQAEISRSDARQLGVDAPVRQSGDVSGTPGIMLASQQGVISLASGLIVAERHLHMTPEDAESYSVTGGQKVRIRVNGSRPVVFEEVLVRVSPKYRLAMHIDFDEANCCGWQAGASGLIVRNS